MSETGGLLLRFIQIYCYNMPLNYTGVILYIYIKMISFIYFSLQEAELNNQNLPGDALILAAIITYLGPFAPDVRTELLSKWRHLCKTGSINMNPVDPRTSLFTPSDPAAPRPALAFPIPVSERLQLPLGRALGLNVWQLHDTVSARLLIQLLLWGYRSFSGQRWPLLADIQQHQDINYQSWLNTCRSLY